VSGSSIDAALAYRRRLNSGDTYHINVADCGGGPAIAALSLGDGDVGVAMPFLCDGMFPTFDDLMCSLPQFLCRCVGRPLTVGPDDAAGDGSVDSSDVRWWFQLQGLPSFSVTSPPATPTPAPAPAASDGAAGVAVSDVAVFSLDDLSTAAAAVAADDVTVSTDEADATAALGIAMPGGAAAATMQSSPLSALRDVAKRPFISTVSAAVSFQNIDDDGSNSPLTPDMGRRLSRISARTGLPPLPRQRSALSSARVHVVRPSFVLHCCCCCCWFPVIAFITLCRRCRALFMLLTVVAVVLRRETTRVAPRASSCPSPCRRTRSPCARRCGAC
jgi:hypothetical protein